MPGNNKHIKLTLTFDNDAWNILSLCPIGSEAKELIKDQNLSPEFAYDLFRDPLTFGFEYEFIFMKPDSSPIFTIEENGQIIYKTLEPILAILKKRTKKKKKISRNI